MLQITQEMSVSLAWQQSSAGPSTHAHSLKKWKCIYTSGTHAVIAIKPNGVSFAHCDVLLVA
jgi:hypothetical protein